VRDRHPVVRKHPDKASAAMIAVIENRNARATRTGAIPQIETVLVLHHLWLTKRFLSAVRARGEKPSRPKKAGNQAVTPTPIGHDTPVPPSPQ
jgi:hypothetical protein